MCRLHGPQHKAFFGARAIYYSKGHKKLGSAQGPLKETFRYTKKDFRRFLDRINKGPFPSRLEGFGNLPKSKKWVPLPQIKLFGYFYWNFFGGKEPFRTWKIVNFEGFSIKAKGFDKIFFQYIFPFPFFHIHILSISSSFVSFP